MLRALTASAQGCVVRICLAVALLISSAPALRAANSTSHVQNPVVSFTTPGLKQVTLQACNAGSCTSVTKNVTVLNPMPLVTEASVAPVIAEAGQLVFLTGAGTGKPPLAFTWQVAPIGGAPFASLPGASLWWNTAGVPSGVYTATLRIQNSAGSVASLPLPITLAPATPLDFYTIHPCRIYDSRLWPGPLPSAVTRFIQGTILCGIPVGARALAANVTVIAPTNAGYVTLYPGNYPQPITTTVNFTAGITRSNHLVLPLATTGAGTLAALASIAGNGSTHLVIDVSGYYAP